MVGPPRIIQFPEVLSELMRQRYAGNRAKLAEMIRVSPSALSQYARGKATPSMNVLTDLAHALDVSLDYLVYGSNSETISDTSSWIGHFEETFKKVSTQGDTVRQSVNRVGLMLSGQIEQAVRRVLHDDELEKSGAVTRSEVVAFEKYAVRTRIATISIELDLIFPEEGIGQGLAMPGLFLEAIIGNVARGHEYQYLIPDDARARDQAALLVGRVRGELRSRGLDPGRVDSLLRLNVSERGLVPSYVIYTLDTVSMQKFDPVRFDLIKDDILQVGDSPLGVVALLEPPRYQSNFYYVVGRRETELLDADFTNLSQQSRSI